MFSCKPFCYHHCHVQYHPITLGGGGIHILVHMSKNADSHSPNHQVGRGQDSAEAEKAAPMSQLSHT